MEVQLTHNFEAPNSATSHCFIHKKTVGQYQLIAGIARLFSIREEALVLHNFGEFDAFH